MPRSLARPFSSAPRRDELPWSAVVGALVAALLINGVGLYGTSSALSAALEPVERPEREELVEFDLVEPSSSAKRSVDQDRSNGRQPEDAKRLAEVDSDPEHETQRPLAPATRSAQPTPPTPKPDQTTPPDGVRDGEQGEDRGQGQHEGVGEGEEPGAGDDTLAEAADGQAASAGAESGARSGQPDPLAQLGGSPEMLDRTFGRPGSRERLRDVDEGVENVLESKRHIYASFFNRIRDQVADQWRPQKVHAIADPTGSKYGDKQRTTVLMVRLDAKGEILKIIIERSSGAPHLDSEAVRAMKAAAPFPNPPGGLADGGGHIDFRFGFILDFEGGSRIFRYGG